MMKITRSEIIGNIKSIAFAIILAMIFRSFLYEPFHIPTGSMKPGLLVGDYLFVSKYSYGYSRYSLPFGPNIIDSRIFFNSPERGDVVVFKLPKDNSTNYIKRLIGLPGDKIQVKNGILYINGKEIERKDAGTFTDSSSDGSHKKIIRQYEEILPNGVSYLVIDEISGGIADNTAIFEVPQGHYFFMGDNRDNSEDSRFADVGYVPEINLMGKAQIVFFSTQFDFSNMWKIIR